MRPVELSDMVAGRGRLFADANICHGNSPSSAMLAGLENRGKLIRLHLPRVRIADAHRDEQ